ncbi:hypothetical protein G0Q06_04065 [Puniceicoccales bacterium CK1056]|uniref:Uncharacterized protein n=1 Tax=Oceanipulchritudo coccoides TaxID=2706888 RepID=A0A6B2LYA9_9BACT|nr:hypothetical protein [Oceanipulchritudo coccoides]NDV61618.1 hypothetical protein [Oceanipulchritudo coccoides]
MKTLGFLIQLATAGLMGYLGYIFFLNLAIFPVAAFGILFGHIMRRNAKLGISDFFSGYFVALLLCVVFFGVGYGMMHILDLRPAEGVGRY